MLRAAEIETFEVWKGKGFPEVKIYPDSRHHGNTWIVYIDTREKLLKTIRILSQCSVHNPVVYNWLNMPDTAELLHNQALDLRKIIYGETSREVADSYLWRGVLYNWGLQRKDLAERNYRSAQELQKKFMPDSRYALGSVYFRAS